MEKCAWHGVDGRCQNETKCQYKRGRIKCNYPLSNCSTYITERKAIKKHNKKAHDRLLTRDTRYLVNKWHEEGESILMIAVALNRTTTAIEEILHSK